MNSHALRQQGLSLPCLPFHHTRVWSPAPESNRPRSALQADASPLCQRDVATPAGLEPATCRLGGDRSIRLGYEVKTVRQRELELRDHQGREHRACVILPPRGGPLYLDGVVTVSALLSSETPRITTSTTRKLVPVARNRTCDLPLTRRLLCRLSYTGVIGATSEPRTRNILLGRQTLCQIELWSHDAWRMVQDSNLRAPRGTTG